MQRWGGHYVTVSAVRDVLCVLICLCVYPATGMVCGVFSRDVIPLGGRWCLRGCMRSPSLPHARVGKNPSTWWFEYKAPP
ncbi:hypothetical protein V8E53_008571, partial [Lactarius tabidus]